MGYLRWIGVSVWDGASIHEHSYWITLWIIFVALWYTFIKIRCEGVGLSDPLNYSGSSYLYFNLWVSRSIHAFLVEWPYYLVLVHIHYSFTFRGTFHQLNLDILDITVLQCVNMLFGAAFKCWCQACWQYSVDFSLSLILDGDVM